LGSSTAITASSAPASNMLRASASTPCGEVRSPMPTSSVRLPITSRSPPSTTAG
jgi:hypothetical protein